MLIPEKFKGCIRDGQHLYESTDYTLHYDRDGNLMARIEEKCTRCGHKGPGHPATEPELLSIKAMEGES